MKRKSHEKRLSEQQLLNLLRDIEQGEVGLTLDRLASAAALEVENGIYYFNTSDKWQIAVFVDCGKFDYIEHMQHGGVKIDNRQLRLHYPAVEHYAIRFRENNAFGIEKHLYQETA